MGNSVKVFRVAVSFLLFTLFSTILLIHQILQSYYPVQGNSGVIPQGSGNLDPGRCEPMISRLDLSILYQLSSQPRQEQVESEETGRKNTEGPFFIIFSH